jgi:hypothetical protein
VSPGFGVIIEAVVALLLLVTIGYCIVLNRRLMRLKADEQTLKATISELITATEIAERAIAGLKVAVQECDESLGRRLKVAEATSANIGRQVAAGEQLFSRLAQITGVTAPQEIRPAAPAPVPTLVAGAAPAAVSDARATAAAAQAFAARARLRAQGAAA